MKTNRIVFYVATGLLSLMTVGSAAMYFFNNGEVVAEFVKLGFPVYIVYPLAIAKLLGIAAIWTRLNRSLVEWAYAGFFFDFLLAGSAHIVAQDGEAGGAAIALVLLLVSYFFYRRTFLSPQTTAA